MSTHDICFYGEKTKIIIKLSSNTLKSLNYPQIPSNPQIILKYPQIILKYPPYLFYWFMSLTFNNFSSFNIATMSGCHIWAAAWQN